MPQSNRARENEINNHPEHVADRAQASHEHQSHLAPEERDLRNQEQQCEKLEQAAQTKTSHQ